MKQENLVIYEEEIKQIDRLLMKLLKGAEAKCALLVDKDGHLVTRQGFTHSLDTTALAALLAGSFASTREIARLVGEPEFSVLFHQGKKDHIHISLVGERSILVVIFDDRTTIGMVRLYAKEIGEELGLVLAGAKNRKAPETNAFDTDYTQSAGNKLDDLLHE
ncbi:MAG: roadblock/LC7 domain-containing protein [candidate division Zixibacteria bacterium]|jgi:predicted regulator of Ras-like GTPase activity (Roadblock/LC7/MglB family)|nr:roadblock/LC7 domain-containing protein [candidate division Zixibacteria bacterium]